MMVSSERMFWLYESHNFTCYESHNITDLFPPLHCKTARLKVHQFSPLDWKLGRVLILAVTLEQHSSVLHLKKMKDVGDFKDERGKRFAIVF